ncbi:MAG: hypothetical protein JWO59_1515 [Chloroflexi bacterium]|nr:hypothetical protein [Chloroflexota bacterium]
MFICSAALGWQVAHVTAAIVDNAYFRKSAAIGGHTYRESMRHSPASLSLEGLAASHLFHVGSAAWLHVGLVSG